MHARGTPPFTAALWLKPGLRNGRSSGRGRGVARGAEQPIAARVPRLRGNPWSIDSILCPLSLLTADGADDTDAQTTCLEPDRHDAENNVSVPISAPRGTSTDFGNRGLEQYRVCHSIGSRAQDSNLPEGTVTFHLHRSRTWILLLQLVNDAGILKTGVHEKGAETKNNCGRFSFCSTHCRSKDRLQNGAQADSAIATLAQWKKNGSRGRTDQAGTARAGGQTRRHRLGNASQANSQTTQNTQNTNACRGKCARRKTVAN